MRNQAGGCGAVILAGGRGERMGGRSKAELRFQGQSYKKRILGELGGLGIPCFFSAGAYPAEEDGECPVIFSYARLDELAGFVIGLAEAQAAERGMGL